MRDAIPSNSGQMPIRYWVLFMSRLAAQPNSAPSSIQSVLSRDRWLAPKTTWWIVVELPRQHGDAAIEPLVPTPDHPSERSTTASATPRSPAVALGRSNRASKASHNPSSKGRPSSIDKRILTSCCPDAHWENRPDPVKCTTRCSEDLNASRPSSEALLVCSAAASSTPASASWSLSGTAAASVARWASCHSHKDRQAVGRNCRKAAGLQWESYTVYPTILLQIPNDLQPPTFLSSHGKTKRASVVDIGRPLSFSRLGRLCSLQFSSATIQATPFVHIAPFVESFGLRAQQTNEACVGAPTT